MHVPDPDRDLGDVPLWFIAQRLAARIVKNTDDTRLVGLDDLRAAIEEAIRREIDLSRVLDERPWADIARDLGVTTQAAQQRYGRPARPRHRQLTSRDPRPNAP